MRNALRILKRDVLRLVKAPAALVVAIALLVLPSLYTWYNIVAFWNPYDATGNLTVCVVNQDEGADTDVTGHLNVGELLEEELLAMDRLHFVSKGYDEAMADLESGQVYAVYIVPNDFSSCLVSPVTGHVERPKIQYYSNEKLGPVTPKITDTAATTLGQTINSLFVEKVSEVVVNAIDNALADAKGDASKAHGRATSRTAEAIDDIAAARLELEKVQQKAADAQEKTKNANDAMDDAFALTDDARSVLADVSDEADAVQQALSTVASASVESLSDVVADASAVAANASTVTDGIQAKAGTAQSMVDMAAGRAQPLIDALMTISADLQSVADILPGSSSLAGRISESAQDASDRAAQLQSLVGDAQDLSNRIVSAAQSATDAANSLEASAQQASDDLQTLSSSLYGNVAPTVNASLAQVGMTCGRLSTSMDGLDTAVRQAKAALAQLDGLLGDCGKAVSQTEGLLGEFQGDLESILADINVLANSDAVAALVDAEPLNSSNISAFMSSPTELSTEEFYHPNVYGTAMAPLFMNLTFWIGAFMLVIIFRVEVDGEGVEKATPSQRYLGRLLLFSGFVVGQAIICCAGTLAIGVQAANVPALFLASAAAALAYLGVIYALSATLRHIGKALCIILVFAQIPGGSGLYPLELTSGFFQAIYPFLPFSYGIGALREAIFGFYGDYFTFDLSILGLIFVSMLIAGMALVPLMSGVMSMAVQQIREGGLYNGADAVVAARPLRLSQLISALSDREDYLRGLNQRYERFKKMYPIFIRSAIVLGVGVPVALMLLLTLDAGEKVILLTVFLLWLVALTVFLLIVESMRYSFERQLNVESMSDEGIVKMILGRNRMRPAFAGITRSRARGKAAARDASGEADGGEVASSNGPGDADGGEVASSNGPGDAGDAGALSDGSDEVAAQMAAPSDVPADRGGQAPSPSTVENGADGEASPPEGPTDDGHAHGQAPSTAIADEAGEARDA